MEALTFIKKLDLDKLDLANITSNYFSLSAAWDWEVSYKTDLTPSKVDYYPHGFTIPFKDKTLKEYKLNIIYDKDFSFVKVSGFGITYVSTNLNRRDREWLEDWSRRIAEEVYELKEEKFLSFLKD